MNTIRIALMFTLLIALTGSVSAADGEGVWKKNCLSCHGKDGKGNTRAGKMAKVKDLTDAKYQATFTDEYAVKRLKEGIEENGKVRMKPFADKLTGEEMKAVVAFVRSLKE